MRDADRIALRCRWTLAARSPAIRAGTPAAEERAAWQRVGAIAIASPRGYHDDTQIHRRMEGHARGGLHLTAGPTIGVIGLATEAAKKGCPVSKALAGPKIKLSAKLTA